LRRRVVERVKNRRGNFMPRWLNIEEWKRKNQFNFFKDFDNPFFNICTDVDVSELYNFSKKSEFSFFLTSIYATLKAANLIEEFRYRIKDGGVIVHDQIHAGSTFLKDDNTFGFVYLNYKSSINDFYPEAEIILEKTKQEKDTFDPRSTEDDLVHYSVIPWISFLSISHARKFSRKESIPKIVLGKYYEKDKRLIMPISIELHHSLADGLLVANYLEKLQEILDQPALTL
jgi:chloramphenicol O-acetyltransferase type A